MSALSQIFAVLDERLRSLPGVPSYERMPTGDPDEFPAVELYDRGDKPDEDETDASRRKLTISVQGFVQSGSGASTHDEMTALHALVVQALMTEPPLDGLVERIESDGDREPDAPALASERRMGFAQGFTITFATVRGDPDQFA